MGADGIDWAHKGVAWLCIRVCLCQQRILRMSTGGLLLKASGFNVATKGGVGSKNDRRA